MKQIKAVLLAIVILHLSCNSAPPESANDFPLIPENPIAKFVSNLDDETLVAQLFMVRTDQYSKLPEVTPGGVIFFASDINSPTGLKTQIQNFQNNATIPLFLGIDEEGGTVSRLKRFYPDILSISARDLQNKDQQAITEHAQEIGSLLSELGISVNFAPVADILEVPNTPLLRNRSFGTSQEIVSESAAAFLHGLGTSNIMGVYKHFPGHGAVTADSHTSAAVIDLPLDYFKEKHLYPYVNRPNDLQAVMVAHITIPQLSNLPATLSKEIILGILRTELEFEGLIFSDAMNMGAITNFYNSAEASILAIEAGIDIILIPQDYPASYRAVLAALKQGTLSRERLEESVQRIIFMKQIYCGYQIN